MYRTILTKGNDARTIDNLVLIAKFHSVIETNNDDWKSLLPDVKKMISNEYISLEASIDRNPEDLDVFIIDCFYSFMRSLIALNIDDGIMIEIITNVFEDIIDPKELPDLVRWFNVFKVFLKGGKIMEKREAMIHIVDLIGDIEEGISTIPKFGLVVVRIALNFAIQTNFFEDQIINEMVRILSSLSDNDKNIVVLSSHNIIL